MANTISNTDSVIDSRDIIARVEELKEKHTAHAEDASEPALDEEERAELEHLVALTAECESCADWEFGETLVHESYFTTYIQELVADCYDDVGKAPKGKENSWPYKHVTIDWDACAEEAKQDYTEVDFNGETYYIRDC